MIELPLTDENRCQNGHILTRSPASESKPAGSVWCRECAQGRQARYRANHPERHRERGAVARANMRAREQGIVGTLTVAEWRAVLDDYERRCAYCLAPYDCLDHVLAFSRGGTNEIANVVPACKPCNDSKEGRGFVPSIASRFWPPDEGLFP